MRQWRRRRRRFKSTFRPNHSLPPAVDARKKKKTKRPPPPDRVCGRRRRRRRERRIEGREPLPSPAENFMHASPAPPPFLRWPSSPSSFVGVVVRRWESPHKVFFFILLATHPLDLSFSPLWEGGGRGGGRGYAVHFFFLSTLSLVASQGSIRRRRRRWSSFFFLFSPNCFKLVFRPFF